MILYVDETESDSLFIVAGLLFNSRQDAEQVFKRFKKRARNVSIADKYRARLFYEFKSNILDKDFQHLKKEMLNILNEFQYQVIFGCHTKPGEFKQKDKERTYINMLTAIVTSIPNSVDVYFDGFRNQGFENSIIKKLESLPNVRSAKPTVSETEHGIIVIDNLCSVIRRHEMNQDNAGFFTIIAHNLKMI